MTWKEHKAYIVESWNEFYTYWKNAPLWQWFAQIFMLAAFAFLLLFSTHMFVGWAEAAEATPLNEVLGFFMLMSIPIGLIIAMRGLALMIVWIARILDLK